VAISARAHRDGSQKKIRRGHRLIVHGCSALMLFAARDTTAQLYRCTVPKLRRGNAKNGDFRPEPRIPQMNRINMMVERWRSEVRLPSLTRHAGFQPPTADAALNFARPEWHAPNEASNYA